MNKTMAKVMAIIMTIVVVLGIYFGFNTFVIYIASKIFGFTFKWIYVIGLMIATTILTGIFKSGKD